MSWFRFFSSLQRSTSLLCCQLNALTARMHREPTPDPTTKRCADCLSEIPIDVRHCAFCTTTLQR